MSGSSRRSFTVRFGRPVLRLVQVAPPSVVRETRPPDPAAHAVKGSCGSTVICVTSIGGLLSTQTAPVPDRALRVMNTPPKVPAYTVLGSEGATAMVAITIPKLGEITVHEFAPSTV